MIKTRQSGLTMIELLVVLAILAILMIIAILAWRTQTEKAYDARRKKDLNQIKIAFEDYNNDNQCYPPADALQNCGSKDLHPYLRVIPCDPTTNEPYEYIRGANCSGYTLYARLQNQADPDLNAGECFGVTAGEVLEDCPPAPTQPTPLPSPWGGYACDPHGQCNAYTDPEGDGCPVAFTDATECQNACDASSSNWCPQ